MMIIDQINNSRPLSYGETEPGACPCIVVRIKISFLEKAANLSLSPQCFCDWNRKYCMNPSQSEPPHDNMAMWSSLLSYTGCPRRNVPDFGRVFLMLKYTDITQNTYVQSWRVTEIMAREVWKFDSCYTLTDYQIHIKTGRNMWFL